LETLYGTFQQCLRGRYNSTGSKRIWMKFGALRVYCLELALTDFGRDLHRSKSGRLSLNFFCQLNNARLYWFPLCQISLNWHTRRGSMSPWILRANLENLPVRVFFPKRQHLLVNLHTDFRPRFLLNDYKSRKVMTVWHSYGSWLSIYAVGINLKWFSGLQAAYKERHSWTSLALPSSAPDIMSQSHSHGGANKLALTLHYC